MNDIDKLREKHRLEIEYLRNTCPHTEFRILKFGHIIHPMNFSHFSRVCDNCEKDIERLDPHVVVYNVKKKCYEIRE
jgi:hypothetical protein